MPQDRSFTFILKTPPASVLLQKAAGVPKGSGTPNSAKVGQVTRAQLKVHASSICYGLHECALVRPATSSRRTDSVPITCTIMAVSVAAQLMCWHAWGVCRRLQRSNCQTSIA